MSRNNPLRPIFSTEVAHRGDNSGKLCVPPSDRLTMTIRKNSLGETYNLPHLIAYWKQHYSKSDLNEIISEISYHWSEYPGFLRSIWPSGVFSDLVLYVSGQPTKYKVHKLLLSVASTYFANLFEKSKIDTVEIIDIEPEILKQMLDIVYGNRVIFTGINGLKLLVALKKYQFNGISEEDVTDIIETLVIGSELNQVMEFVNLVEIMYDNNTPDWFKSHLFNNLTPKSNRKMRVLLKILPIPYVEYFEEGYVISPSDEEQSVSEEN